MDRRVLIAGSLAAAATPAVAAGPTASSGGGAAVLNIAGLGLPIITEGRVRNYVFVSLRLHLGGGRTPEQMRAKEPFFRDALIRAGHRTPFVTAGDWTQLNAAALSASLMRVAPAISGRGSVTRVEVVSQSPRRRTGVRSG